MAQILDSWVNISTVLASPGSRAVPTGTDRVLVARSSLRSTSDSTITALSWGGQAMTLVARVTTTVNPDLDTAIWILGETGIGAAVGTAFTLTDSGSVANAQFRLHVATYELVDQADSVVDSFTASSTGAANPTAVALATVDGGVAIAFVAANRGTSDAGATENASYSNMTERLETAATNQYASTAEADTDGSNFTPGTTLVHADRGHLIGVSLRDASTNVAVGQASETDTGLAVDRQKALGLGQASEADTGQAVTPSKRRVVGLASETDTGQSVAPVAGAGTVVVGQASETDTGQAVTPSKIRSVGQAVEVDAALSAQGIQDKIVPVGQASETDSAQSVISSQVNQTELEAQRLAYKKRFNTGSGRARKPIDVLTEGTLIELVRVEIAQQYGMASDRQAVAMIEEIVQLGWPVVMQSEIERGAMPSARVLEEREKIARKIATKRIMAAHRKAVKPQALFGRPRRAGEMGTRQQRRQGGRLFG